ncbi:MULTISPECIES: hypothetical protein [unclassified Novosphingobium]|uniref:hypothetical protein n=1 Tax=unclassified Novosphingobium TaxID=2644732 RepID=UPI00135C81E8|nr:MULTISPECIES: hypothetical protein [unclassified Novosphingobium]
MFAVPHTLNPPVLSLSKGAGAALALLLGACSNSEPPPIAAGDEHIDCAVGGSVQMKPVCAVERIETDGKHTLVVRHPDGAFRRFDVTEGGASLAPSDGADKAVTSLANGKLDITVGGDHYLFPATEMPDGAD